MDEQDDRRPGEQAPESVGPPPASAPLPPPDTPQPPPSPSPAPAWPAAPPPAPAPDPTPPRAEEQAQPPTPEPAAVPTSGRFDPPPAPVGASVDRPPATVPQPAPRPVAASTAPRSRGLDAVAGDFADDLADEEGYDDEASRWVTLLATVGLAIIGIVTVQVAASLVQGFTTRSGDRLQGVSDDFLHRLGYPFDSLGSTALLFLVLGIVLLALPAALDEYLPENQERSVGIALRVAIAVAVVVAIGSVLAVRATLHLYSASNSAVPTAERIRFTTFLLGALGAAALALYAALAALSQRARERWDD